MGRRAANIDLGIPAPKEVYGYKVYLIVLISSMGAFLFGYDLGFIGTAISLPSFQKYVTSTCATLANQITYHTTSDFHLTHKSQSEKDAFSANVVSLLQAGCIVGVLAAAPFSDTYGRRPTLFLTALIFNLGSALQTGANGSWALMLAGRAIGGIGVGAASMIVPVYVAEVSPPLIRGRLVGIYEVFVSAGTMLGFWINYGLAKNVPPSSKQWIISFAVQLIPGSLLLIGTFFIPESPRYLAQSKGRDKCIASLQRLRCIPSDHPYLLEEVHRIFQQIEHEEAIAEGHGIKTFLKELAKPGNQKRLLTGCLMFIFMQMAGSNAINYYSPAIFKSIGLTGPNTAFFATGIYGVVRFVAIIFAMVYVVDRFGRTRTLMAGSVVMVSKFV